MWRAIFATLLLVGAGTLFALGAVESALRMFPSLLPAGVYGGGRFDPSLRMNVHGRTVLYNKQSLVVRVPNRDGFLDIDHEPIAAPGVFRVGFFGDSYVEAAQVPLDLVFFRQLAERVPSIETIAAGVSGWGTLQAFTAWKILADRYDLDAAIYVFVENDLGDQDAQIALASGATAPTPVAEPSDAPPGYQVRWLNQPDAQPWWKRGAKLLQRHSLLARVVYDRIALLRNRGVSVRLEREEVEMTRAAGALPNSNDLASTWPPAHRGRVTRLGEAVLADWKRAADARGMPFAVLYVPRSQQQVEGHLAADQTWISWIRATCDALDIPLIDPSPALAALAARGEAAYADHWTPAGHAVIADVLADHFATMRSDANGHAAGALTP